MKTHTENSSETKKEAVSKEETKNSKTANQPFQFVDNRPETIAQLKMKEMLKNSQQTMQMKNEQERPNVNTTATDELSKKEIAPFQLKEDPTGDAPPTAGSSDPNKTGLPDNLKTGMESLSGMPLDDVNVHYNSEKPAQLQALAYAQGTDIHLGPGQEEHLPHELGHVVQQKKGTVKPTMQMMGKSEGVPVNDDPQLEREADLMGGEALQMKANEKESNPVADKLKQGMSALSSGKGPVQREEDPYADPTAEEGIPGSDPNATATVEDSGPTAEEAASQGTDEDNINEEAIEGGYTNNLIEYTKEGFKEQLDSMNKDIVPSIEVEVVHNFVTPSGIPLYLRLKEKTEFKYGIDIGGTSEVVGASIKVGAFGGAEGSIGVGIGAGMPNKLLFGLGLSGKIALPIQIGPELKFTYDKGFEPGPVEFKAELNANLLGDFTILGQTYSVTLTGAKIAEVSTTFNPGMGPLTFEWKFEPTEDSIFPATEFFNWLNADNKAIEFLSQLSISEIDQLPVHIKSGILANINDIFVSWEDIEYMWKLLDISQNPTSPFSQNAWTVLEQAYEKSEGSKPTGFQEMHDWLTSAASGGVGAVIHENAIDKSLTTNEDEETEHLVDIQLRCDCAVSGNKVEMWGFTVEISGATTDLTDAEEQEVRNEINAKKRPGLQNGFSLSTGKRIRVSYHIEFIGGGSMDYWNNSYSLNDRVGSKDDYFIGFLTADTRL
jgi:hypothetical protein